MTDFSQILLEWFEDHKREFFWREKELNPFQFLLVELLLKRTRAETVDRYGEGFIDSYKSPEEIISQERDKLKKEIEELGYYSRIDELISISEQIKSEGGLKADRAFLLNIKGLGQYTVDAVLCYGYTEPRVPLDANVERVGRTYFNIETPSDLRHADELKNKMEQEMDKKQPKKFNWALQDLGAALKKKEDPLGLK